MLRCSSEGTRLWTHYDAMDNALIQLHGEKRVLLFPPRVSAGLYLEGSSSPVVGWEVDGHEKNETDDGTKPARNETAFPAYARRAPRSARGSFAAGRRVVHPRALGAPHGGHARPVRRGERVLARAPEDRVPAEGPVRQRRPAAAAEALRLVEAAAKALANAPREHKAFYGTLAASRLLRDLRVERDVASTFAAFGERSESDAASEATSVEDGAEDAVPDPGRPERTSENGTSENASALGALFAPPASWADVAKGAALGIGAFIAWRRVCGSPGRS